MNYKHNGKKLDIVSYFKYHALVQCVETKKVYILAYEDFDAVLTEECCKIQEESNVISFNYWVDKCLKKNKKIKQRANKQVAKARDLK